MTLILKSNIQATNAVGNVHGYTGATDFVAMLDFARGEYFTKVAGARTDYGISDVLSVARASGGYYFDRDGVRRAVLANAARFPYVGEYDVSGLAVEDKVTNLASAGVDETVVTITASSASQDVFLSFAGGDASLAAAELALLSTFTLSNGRTVKRYDKTVSTQFNATLSVSGGAVDIQVEILRLSQVFVGYGAAQEIETVSLKAPILSLLSGGAGSIIARTISYPTPLVGAMGGNVIAAKSGVGQGGIFCKVSSTETANGTDVATIAADGAAVNAAVTKASLSGNWRDATVKGLTFEGFGAKLGVISYGQYAKNESSGVTMSALASVYLGGDSGSLSLSQRMNGVITHVVVYDRMLTDNEALESASMWL